MKYLFVCTGNICRSPTADGILRHRLRQMGLEHGVDSAGTHAYHVGEAPDPRTVHHAKKRGYDLSALRARVVTARDFHEYDVILAMDGGHLRFLEHMEPADAKAELALFLPYGGVAEVMDVPDPYYGGARHFEQVLDLVEQAVDGMIARLQSDAGR